MALTREDLQAIGALMDDKLEPINSRLDKLEQGQNEMKSDISRLDQNVGRLNQSVVVLESKLERDFEIIKEGIGGWTERNRQIDKQGAEIEELDHRVWALEQVVKK
jgi:polyhydroxyalkanoate synthesis regulator phasin